MEEYTVDAEHFLYGNLARMRNPHYFTKQDEIRQEVSGESRKRLELSILGIESFGDYGRI